MSRLTRTGTFPAAAAGLLVLSACTAGGGAGDATPPATPDDTATPTQEATTGTSQAGGECLEGEWDTNLDQAERNAVESLQLGDLEVDPQVEITGESWVEIDGSTLTTYFEDQSTTITFAVEGDDAGDVVVSAALDGSTSAGYTADDSTLTVEDVDVSDLTSEVTAELGGEEYELPGVEDLGGQTFALNGQFTYTCDDDELRLTPVVDEDLAEPASPEPTATATEPSDDVTEPSDDATAGTDDDVDGTEVEDAEIVLTRR